MITLPSLDKLECQITADIHLQMQQEKLSQILPYLVGYELMYEMRLDNYLDRKTHYKLHS